MTSSGTYDFSPSIGQCILAAFERIQLRAPEIRIEHMNTAKMESNLLMSRFSNLQPNLWKVEQIATTLVSGTATYDVPARVVMILDAWVRTNSGTANQTDRYITPVSRTEYASFANKATSGPPTTFWFNRQIAPTVTMWPVPDSAQTYILDYYACSQIQDTGLTGGQTPDLPYLWLDAYVAGLAHRFARVYKPELEQQRKADADEAWQIAATQNTEGVPISFAPMLGGYYRR